MIKIFLIGCVEFSQKCFNSILELYPKIQLAGVATKEKSAFNSDFYDLAPLAKSKAIPVYYASDINSEESLDFIKSCNPDLLCCLGWSSLIKDKLLELYPIIGYHPAELPKNRGRHPLIWAIALGLSQTASTFFLMDKGADSGDILSQKIVPITHDDNARSMYDKLTFVALSQLQELLLTLNKNQKVFSTIQQNLHSIAIPQDHSHSNTWRKRNRMDGLIDFRMSSEAIYNLIRALSHPYPGAEIEYNGDYFKIWDCKIINYPYNNIESGKILQIENNEILVKTYDGAILLTQHELPPNITIGEYL